MHVCRFECENCYHYFMECSLYDSTCTCIRRKLFEILRLCGEIDLNISFYRNLELALVIKEICKGWEWGIL